MGRSADPQLPHRVKVHKRLQAYFTRRPHTFSLIAVEGKPCPGQVLTCGPARVVQSAHRHPVQLAHIVDRLYSVARDARMRNSKQETLYALDVIYIHLSVSKNYWGRKARPSLLPIDDTYFVIILPWYRAAIRCQMPSHQHSSPQPAIVPGNDWLWNAAGAGSNAATLCI